MAGQQRGTHSISVAFTTFSSDIKGPIKVPVKPAVKAAVEVLSALARPRCCCLRLNLNTADTGDKGPLLNLPACLNSGLPIYAIPTRCSLVSFSPPHAIFSPRALPSVFISHVSIPLGLYGTTLDVTAQ